MTSTEFTVGLDGSRASSKVLRPPGGGSSDIFGMCSAQNTTPKSKPARGGGGGYSDIFGVGPAQTATPRSQPEPPKAQEAPASQPEPEPAASIQPEPASTPEPAPSSQPEPEPAPCSQPEPASAPETAANSQPNTQSTPVKPQSDYAQTQNRLFGGGDPTFTPGRRQIKTNMFAHQTPLAPPPPPRTTYDGEGKTAEEPAPKPITTSIRVRNPPGGHSSGIF